MAKIQSPAGATNTLDGVAWPQGGGNIDLVAGGSLTLTPNNVTKEIIMSVSSGTGSLPEGWVLASDYGVVGDGITNDSAAIQAAENVRQSVNGILIFGPGTYLVTTQIDVGDRCAWFGVRTERGQNAFAEQAAYAAVTIKWRPASSATYLISEFRAASTVSMFGPYEFVDLNFDLNGNNGIELGRDTADLGSTAAWIQGVAFKRCNFGNPQIANSSSTGVLTRTGRRCVSLGNWFEGSFVECSWFGGDVHVFSRGHDAPTFTRCRHVFGAAPYELKGGSSAVHAKFDKMEFEGWHLSPISAQNAPVQISDSTWENHTTEWMGDYSGRLTLSETFSVTAGSATVTASATMANKLFPGHSLLELTDGTNKDTVLVTAVSGTSVTVNSDTFAFDWTAGSATGVRIHGHGPVSYGSDNSMQIVSCYPNPNENTPCVVHEANTGHLSMTACTAHAGSSLDQRALILGNKLLGDPYLDSGAFFDGCNSQLVPNPAHPLVTVTNTRSRHGWHFSAYSQHRPAMGKLAEERDVARRVWMFTPKSAASSINDFHLIPFKMVAGMANTEEQVAVWSLNASQFLALYDRTLPTSGYIRVTVRARAKTTSGTLTVAGIQQDVNTTNFFTPTVTTTWQTFTFFGIVPAAAWTTSRVAVTEVGIQAVSTQAYYLAAIEVEELLGPGYAFGAGTPEGSVSLPVGWSYGRTDGGTNTSLYVKQSGTGNTGWSAVTP